MLEIADAITASANRAVEQKAAVFFFIDLDENEYWTEDAVPETDGLPDEEKEICPVTTQLFFTRGKNSSKETDSGNISFLFLPDGTKEFGLISIFDPETEDLYTLFINPYLSATEIYKGAINFDEHQTM